MIVVAFKYGLHNGIETKDILANSIEEAEDYLRTVMRNGIYKIQELNILHFYTFNTPSNFTVKRRDEHGFPTAIAWKDKEAKSSGIVKEWTELPKGIQKFKISKKEVLL
jgi:hypothetical protein